MIGEDDLASFFDPDEFGQRVTFIEPGRPAREVNGMEEARNQSGKVYRSGSDPGAANLRVRPNQIKFQVALCDLPDEWQRTKVLLRRREYSIANTEPLGRLRMLLTLVPFGTQDDQPEERGKWRAST